MPGMFVLIWCMSHGRSKYMIYGHEIPQFLHFLPNLLHNYTCRLHYIFYQICYIICPAVCTRLPRGKQCVRGLRADRPNGDFTFTIPTFPLEIWNLWRTDSPSNTWFNCWSPSSYFPGPFRSRQPSIHSGISPDEVGKIRITFKHCMSWNCWESKASEVPMTVWQCSNHHFNFVFIELLSWPIFRRKWYAPIIRVGSFDTFLFIFIWQTQNYKTFNRPLSSLKFVRFW